MPRPSGPKPEPPTLRPDFRSLFWPLTRKGFFEDYWDRRPFVSHGPARRLARIERDLGDLDITALAAAAKAPDAWVVSRDGQYRSIPADPDDARHFYEAGLTLYLKNIEALQPWTEGLSRELGMRGDGFGSVFASPPGAGARLHFDATELFTIQLRGRKRWTVAPNEHLTNPDDNWVTGRSLPEEIRLYCSEELPEEMPPNSTTFELRPGSVLYMPRGYWHSTETIEDSLSVELGPPFLSWGDLLLDGLRTVLLSNEGWRERALGAWGSKSQRTSARRRLRDLMATLPDELAKLHPEDLVEDPSERLGARAADPNTRYRRNPLAAFGIEQTSGNGRHRKATVTFVSYYVDQPRTTECELDERSVELCRWIADRNETFTGEQARDAVGGLSGEELAALLDELGAAGFIRVVLAGAPGQV